VGKLIKKKKRCTGDTFVKVYLNEMMFSVEVTLSIVNHC